MSDAEKSKHWSVIAVVIAVSGLLLFTLITFQVHHTEQAVLLRFGQPMTERDTLPGLHIKFPFESVWRIDNRIHCTDGAAGVVEEVFTKDEKNVIVSVYLCWRVAAENGVRFMESVGSVDRGEEELTVLLRSFKNGVFGRYPLDALINIDPSKIALQKIETEILDHIASEAERLYGIEVVSVGIKHIGFPESVTGKIFDRMNAERQAEVQRVLSEGEAAAMRIRAEAQKNRTLILAEAESEAKQIRAQGDAEAAGFYEVFQKNPELAAFLRKQDSLRKTLSSHTTLILDTDTVPFDLLGKDALKLKSEDQ